ncbi:uracil-xanthine permease family protein [Hominiventricola aquisgranensis]|jgi:uracil permease|uniref:Uracil-xanthine permease family protein n=1 Tax=Hominiventricola aquisgranensis TaxID=3133164 RepID=A0ABV1HXC2_9FIRM|nr:uracil-xanthine permease family protein [Clostridiaceae bacterium]MDY4546592.1 uracil-xanthine permease family protein [Candidatus Choladocola sp.]RGD95301.1 uracil-xanthine permease [Clostridiales bacterium AM23-16LB]RHO81656.1 uracil-xanthine permease [Clostridiaceae bacterium AF42-6]RHP47722.1 uracil-xanthine permease [Clostridiaceae bacterium AF31-3BH]RHQ22532.1 uracil-xanthine permease [Clostridiaceae bacterium AF29-16BH]RHT83000.1 uracil-xanthine permease [Clostridiaceae bacterium AM
MSESNEVIRDARKLGLPKMLILGLQHMFAMFGATILVPILVNSYFVDACGEGPTRGLTVAVTLFCAGFGTLLFHVCSKMKVPAFLGSSFAFLGGFSTVAHLDTGIYAGMSVNDKAAYACGGVVVAGLLYLVLSLIIRMVGVKRVMRYLPPVVTGPVIICIGLSLASSAIGNASTNWFLAFVALAVIIVFNIWGKGMFKIIPILMGVVISYAVAVIMNAVGLTNPDGSAILDFTSVASAGLVGIPPIQICKFDVTAILVMAPIAIATMMEHVGDMSAISATVGENYLADPGLHRTLLGDGLATALAGFLGGPANTTYGENTGVLELSHVYDPLVIRIAACFAIIISFIPKVSAIISTMPSAIIGGVSFMLYGMISAIGVRNVVENKVDLTKSRNLIIAGVIFVCGLGFSGGLTFTIAGTSITLTALAIAAIAGILLNIILPGNDYEFGVNPAGDENRGIHA